MIAYRPHWLACPLVLALLVFTRPAVAQRGPTNIPDPDPELERQSFVVAEGFEVNLFAADPLIAKPIQMNFDPQGRLWIASSEIYPHIEPGQQANDKILVLEDADGDGKADKTTVFADGLLIPTGVEPGDGGAYVANSTELVHLADTDGDGRADRRRVLLSGFGTEDTHHILHTFRWGPDGMLYFNQSIYIHSHIETPYGVRRLGGGGIWQFRPETLRLEVLCRGFVNPWGHHFDRYGQSLATDGAYGEGVNFVFPGAVFVTAPGAKRIVRGLNPGSPKHCGLEIVSGRHLPESWQGNVITNDFRGHRVCRFVISEDGSGFASREQPELIKSNHVAFRPVDVKMGPDGAIYIADWYNPIIQHGEVDFRDPRRDHTHGRIWRVTAKGRPLVERPKLVGAATRALLDALKAPEDWTRHNAKRVLKERGTEVLPELSAWLAALDPRDADYEHHRLEALWVYQSLNTTQPDLLSALLNSPDHRVRAAATRVLSHWQTQLPNALELLAERVSDEHPRVRLEAVCALAQIPTARSMEIALQALDRPMDEFLDFALWNAARELAPHWLPQLQAGRFNYGGQLRRLTFALEAVDSPAVVKPLLELLAAGKVPSQREPEVLQLVASLGSPTDLRAVLEIVLSWPAAESARRAEMLSSLVQTSQRRQMRPEGDLTALVRLLDSLHDGERAAAVRAVAAWNVSQGRPRLLDMLKTPATSPAVLEASAEALARQADPEVVDALLKLTQSDRPLAHQQIGVTALAQAAPPQAAKAAIGVLQRMGEQGVHPAPVFEAFLSRRQGPEQLAAALAGASLPADVAKLGIRLARSAPKPHQELIDALMKAGNITTGPKQLSPEEMQALVTEVAQRGSAARGEAVFRRKELACFKCHAIAGAGGLVGPDLISLGASAQVDYLIDSLLQPSKAVKENYHALVVTTDEGKIYTGIKVRQTKNELVLRDAEDREVTLPLSSIDEQAPGASLMPVGLADDLTRAELVDLVRFLSALGREDAFRVGRQRVVRRWQVLQPTREAAEVVRRQSFSAVAGDPAGLTWTSAYSTVAGELPLEEVPPVNQRLNSSQTGFVRFHLEVTTHGAVRLAFHSADGLSLWHNGAPVDVAAEVSLDLSPGRHTFLLAVDRNRRRQPLSCELLDVPGSPAQVQIVGGK